MMKEANERRDMSGPECLRDVLITPQSLYVSVMITRFRTSKSNLIISNLKHELYLGKIINIEKNVIAKYTGIIINIDFNICENIQNVNTVTTAIQCSGRRNHTYNVYLSISWKMTLRNAILTLRDNISRCSSAIFTSGRK